ncbi:hypothetical protein [Cellulomonas sp.]|uniref:hypothetical protein n=1 Tax=Cellulomonas sp. TaxID=40001 RepID=UPI001AFFA9ED|nr:hypothetical protein [Cellulomonas sp.]MBO9553832.1 hypothetical protein [Cellulomonas sp.]
MREQDEDRTAAEARSRVPRQDAHRAGGDVRERFGVDLTGQATATGAARDATARAETLRRQADVQRALARDDRGRAVQLEEVAETTARGAEHVEHREYGVGADEAEHGPTTDDAVVDAAHEGARVAYDSGERRDAWASDLERRGVDRELAAGRIRADVSNAHPPTHATRGRDTATRTAGRSGSTTARTRTAARASTRTRSAGPAPTRSR